MTKRTREIRDFIETFILEHGYSPTVREIGAGVGLRSTSTVHSHLLTLRAEGLLDWIDDSGRSLHLTGRAA